MRRAIDVSLSVTWVLLLVFLVAFVGSLILLLRSGGDLPGSIAGLGGLATATIGLLGVLARWSFELFAEKRRRMETLIRAVGLMSTADGRPAPETQQAGALFALASLEQTEFALVLLRDLWPRGRIDAPSAVWLLDRCLESADRSVQDDAAVVLEENAHRLISRQTGGGFEKPACLLGAWPKSLSHDARQAILASLLRLPVGRERGDWEASYLADILIALYLAMRWDGSPEIRSAAANAVRLFAPAVLTKKQRVGTSLGLKSVAELRKEAKAALAEGRDATGRQLPYPTHMRDRIRDLYLWRRRAGRRSRATRVPTSRARTGLACAASAGRAS